MFKCCDYVLYIKLKKKVVGLFCKYKEKMNVNMVKYF